MSLALYERGSALTAALIDRWGRAPAWAQVLALYVITRLWGWVVFLVVGRQQLVSPWGPGPVSYIDFANFWDAGWYRQIAQGGYPSDLPHDSAGHVSQNPWAFYPLYPALARALAELTGARYETAAVWLSLLAGAAATWVVFLLFRASLRALRHRRAHATALWGTAVFLCAPVTPVIQVAYAESLNLLFLAWSLYLFLRRRWWSSAAVGWLACLSRPVGVPLGATAGLWWLVCAVDAARGHEGSLGVRCLAALRATGQQLLAALVTCAGALAWPAIAWAVTGVPDAYTATESAWRGADFVPVEPWFLQGEKYFGVFGPAVLCLFIAAFAVLMISRPVVASLHPVLILWCLAYAGYLLIFLNPQSSLFRLLLPLFPLCLAAVTVSVSRAYRGTLVVAGVVLQFGWVGWLWHWKELPGGGDFPP